MGEYHLGEYIKCSTIMVTFIHFWRCDSKFNEWSWQWVKSHSQKLETMSNLHKCLLHMAMGCHLNDMLIMSNFCFVINMEVEKYKLNY